MNKFLVLAALGNVAFAVNVVVTTICNSATYTTGTLNPLIDSAYSTVTSAGTTASGLLANARADIRLFTGLFDGYKSAFQSFQSVVGSASSLSYADITEIMTVEAQLAVVLNALATTPGYLLSPSSFVNMVDILALSVNAENAAINSLILAGGVACEQQNSLYSVATSLSSSFSVISAKNWYLSYGSTSVAFTGITSKSCTADCTTLTMIAATTSTTSSTESTSSTSDSGDGEITSSRTVSGTVQRCLVRPTSTSTSVTPAITAG